MWSIYQCKSFLLSNILLFFWSVLSLNIVKYVLSKLRKCTSPGCQVLRGMWHRGSHGYCRKASFFRRVYGEPYPGKTKAFRPRHPVPMCGFNIINSSQSSHVSAIGYVAPCSSSSRSSTLAACKIGVASTSAASAESDFPSTYSAYCDVIIMTSTLKNMI